MLVVASVLAAIGTGFVVTLVLADEDGPGRRELSTAQVERSYRGKPLAIPFGPSTTRPPSNVTCMRVNKERYECRLTFRSRSDSNQPIVSYDVVTSAYEPSSEQREAQLSRSIRQGYRMYCPGRLPPVRVDCDDRSRRCTFRAGTSAGALPYDAPLETLIC